ncbi:hypothetical protein DVH24_003941 [Malus domestica]|uniref:Uncharacterized protein n=1 Tax=Malus domestica TaxID=3750 RepID=A0A498K4W4_MALDO|nr:hypothetical protein DVH24_003941 [Malus domestica]
MPLHSLQPIPCRKQYSQYGCTREFEITARYLRVGIPLYLKGIFVIFCPKIHSSSLDKRIPIYVMMPVDAFCIDGTGRPRIRKIKALTVALKALKLAGVHGIATLNLPVIL